MSYVVWGNSGILHLCAQIRKWFRSGTYYMIWTWFFALSISFDSRYMCLFCVYIYGMKLGIWISEIKHIRVNVFVSFFLLFYIIQEKINIALFVMYFPQKLFDKFSFLRTQNTNFYYNKFYWGLPVRLYG